MALSVAPTILTFSDPQEARQFAVVSGGTAPYTVGSSSPTVATASIAGAVVSITGVGAGTTTITITDAALATTTVAVTVAFSTPSFAESLVGYLGAPPTAPSTVFTDFQIQASNPAVEWNPTEVGGEWQEAREIAGDWWFATNASYSTGSWVAVNAALNQYAFKLGKDGSIVRYICTAGTVPLVWTAFWQVDSLGDTSVSIGTTLTVASEIALQANPIWNASGLTMKAFLLSVSDTASATGSLLEDFQVGGVSKWSVRKDGTLVAGIVNTSAISGSPLPIAFGGTGTISPQLRASAPMCITGSWPNMTISNLGVLGICAGTGITLSPSNGVGTVTVTALAAPITVGTDQTWSRITSGTTTLALLTLATLGMTLGTSPLTKWRVYVDAYNGYSNVGNGTTTFGICGLSTGANPTPQYFAPQTPAHSANLCSPLSDICSALAQVGGPAYVGYGAEFTNGGAVTFTINFWWNGATTPMSGWARMYAVAV